MNTSWHTTYELSHVTQWHVLTCGVSETSLRWVGRVICAVSHSYVAWRTHMCSESLLRAESHSYMEYVTHMLSLTRGVSEVRKSCHTCSKSLIRGVSHSIYIDMTYSTHEWLNSIYEWLTPRGVSHSYVEQHARMWSRIHGASEVNKSCHTWS